jgi:hypothetical protein
MILKTKGPVGRTATTSGSCSKKALYESLPRHGTLLLSPFLRIVDIDSCHSREDPKHTGIFSFI